MLGWKSIETRTHNKFAHLVGKRIGIHAGKTWDEDAVGLASPWLTFSQQHATEELRNVRSCLLGTVDVIAHSRLEGADSERALIDCSRTRRYGLFLAAPKLIPDPWDMRGHQGAWKVELGDFRMCRVCGCTFDNACVHAGVPCAWAGQDLCTSCVEHQLN